MAEYLDVLDEKGNPTGERKEKAEMHRDGNWHRAVHVWIINSRGGVIDTKEITHERQPS